MKVKQSIKSQWFGRVPYLDALQLQQHYLQQVREGKGSVLIWLEHPPVITLGRSAKENNIIANSEELENRGIEVVATDRGGDVTFHGPGQLVVYPIFDLSQWDHDIALYVRMLEEVVIKSLTKHYGINCSRLNGYPGIWVGINKICAIGVKVNRYMGTRRFIVTHGLALNVNTDLSYFSSIIPCGLQGKSVTSIQKETGLSDLTLENIMEQMKILFEDVFQIKVI